MQGGRVRSIYDFMAWTLEWRKRIEEVCGDDDMVEFFDQQFREIEEIAGKPR